jgi:hypothetical protein
MHMKQSLFEKAIKSESNFLLNIDEKDLVEELVNPRFIHQCRTESTLKG